MKRILLILAAVLIASPASAQLPPVQVYGSDTGTLRAVTVNASGQLSITCANCSGSGASAVDDAAFTVGTDSAAPAAFLFDDVAPDSVNEGDSGVARMSANRNVYVTIRDAAGNERGLAIDANGALAVTGGGAGVQYTEADTDATITGTALLMEGAANALVPAQGTAADGLLVNLGANNDVTVSGVSTAANQTTALGYLDGLETLIGTTNTNTAAGLTSANFAAAFGTAGTADTQVLSVQGIASGTAITVSPSTGSFASDVVFGTATYTEATSTGPLIGGVRNDTLDALANTTNEIAPLQFNSVGAAYVQPTAGTSGGATSAKRTSVGTTEDEHEIKGSAGTLYSATLTNTNAAARYFRCADQIATSTTPGTTTPIIDLAIPGATVGAGITFAFPVGLSFSTGLTCWFVTGAADTDLTEVAANEIKALYTYK